MFRRKLIVITIAAVTAGLLSQALAAEPAGDQAGNSTAKKPKDDKTPTDVSVADDPQTAMKKMRVTPGLKIEVWAAEPLLTNAVSFAYDGQGRAYVVQTGRRRTSVFDIRNFRDWVDSDLALRSPEERAEFLRKNASQDNPYFMSAISSAKTGNFSDFNHDGRLDWRDLETESESIRLVWDSTGAGVADKAVTFADGFNSIVSGVAAGVAVQGGDVYFACIPDVWKLKAAPAQTATAQSPNSNLPTPARQRLHSGFGVHIAYGGHDMHGLKMGPDGKLYWTIADRGFAPPADIKGYGFTTEFLRRTLPDTGAVFRCDPDGANLEVVAVGLRNPQELAFDQFGNLFTVDNNADGGDKARVEYIVEGADYGWRYAWQHLPKLGAWNTEMLWGLKGSNTALYSLPPVAHVTHGPSGFVYYPGTGLPERFNNHFFIADFPGGVRYFQMKADGAGFTVENPGDFLMDNKPDNMAGKLLWNLYPTDVDFPPGGGIAVLDWVYGWEKTGKGRIYKLTDPAMKLDVAAAETKVLLTEGMEKRSDDELIKLLAHRDQRVRMEAQHQLGTSTESEATAAQRLKTLLYSAGGASHELGQLHALWALSEWFTKQKRKSMFFTNLKPSTTPEVRSQFVKIMGDVKSRSGLQSAKSAITNSSAKVRFFGAQTIGKYKDNSETPSILQFLRDNADRDPYLRHAGVCALVNIGDKDALLTAARDGSDSMRLAALLAMRRLEMPEVAMFLTDADPRLVLEAARAINDAPIESAMPQLAAVLGRADFHVGPNSSDKVGGGGTPPSQALSEFTLRRAINANFRLGKIEHAQSLVTVAENAKASEPIRVEALAALSDWVEPSGRDRVVGLWRPLPKREARAAALPLRMALTGLLTTAPAAVRIAAIEAVLKLEITAAAPELHALVADTAADAAVRIAALRALGSSAFRVPHSALLKDALALATADKSEALRKEASKFLGTGDAAGAVASLTKTLEQGSVSEQQAAYEALATIKGKESDAVIRKALDQLLAGKLRRELTLDVLGAAAKRTSPSIKDKLGTYDAKRDAKDELAPWRETLYGGDAAKGRTIFYERAEAGCFRCHKVSGEGGDVGPELAGLTAQKGRDYLLESILYPNKHIATGFESLNVTLKSGRDYAGLSKGEDATTLTLNSPEDGLLRLQKAEIAKRSTGMSAMPDGIGSLLTKAEVRDLLEFIATAKPPAK